MQIDILTLFPEMFEGMFDASIIKRAQKDKLVKIKIHNLRKWAIDERGTVDDKPYGGGVGMILRPEPVFAAVSDIKEKYKKQLKKKKAPSHTILLTPQGRLFNFRIAEKLSALPHLILICGHYESEDNRIFEGLADEKLSIGDYILTGGEIPAMVLTDSIVRLIKGVLSKEESKKGESFQFTKKGLLKYPQYTRPEEFEGMKVPEILLSGNHGEIKKWRKEQAVLRTKEYRPDLLE
ncbi:MAG: tRNA (guanosine(37)-N1)-methyltransferase TrmD [Candidatus Cloacimonetes bacterium]|nr:tRNA (guanosine(37)-N1)-methyltransferase TrmD [Candidatus Cloacimonadota bacterium]